jgi:Uma2 family endonuclease
MANNTEHYELIASTKYGLERLFHDRDDVFVAADLFWYPVEGKPKIVLAPDVMIAFGRPPGARKSYKQWEENDTPFHVVFEFLSESNSNKEVIKKALFFNRYGVEEYYQFDMQNKNGTLAQSGGITSRKRPHRAACREITRIGY